MILTCIALLSFQLVDQLKELLEILFIRDTAIEIRVLDADHNIPARIFEFVLFRDSRTQNLVEEELYPPPLVEQML